MRFALRRWLFEPEYQVLHTLYLCKKLEARGSVLRAFSRWLWRRYVIGAGCLISPEAQIGQDLHLPHPTGIVISQDVSVGNNVTIYQNVTIGRSTADSRGAPVIGHNVIIYAGAVVLGNIRVNDDAIIGANSVVRTDVPAGATVVGAPAKAVSPIRPA